jgi:hypothetical protein
MKRQIANTEMIARAADPTTSWGLSIMKKFAATTLLGLATLSFANAQVADCAPGKLSDYEKLGPQGCIIGDKKFSNFQYRRGAAGPPSDAISLTPGTTPDSFDPGLLFEGKWASASEKSFVSYSVEVQPNGKLITGASLQMQLGTITGTGKATVLADLCSSDSTADTCGSQTLELKVLLSADGPKTPVDTGQFKEPQKEVHVVTPVDLVAGSGGSAALDGFMEVFR